MVGSEAESDCLCCGMFQDVCWDQLEVKKKRSQVEPRIDGRAVPQEAESTVFSPE